MDIGDIELQSELESERERGGGREGGREGKRKNTVIVAGNDGRWILRGMRRQGNE